MQLNSSNILIKHILSQTVQPKAEKNFDNFVIHLLCIKVFFCRQISLENSIGYTGIQDDVILRDFNLNFLKTQSKFKINNIY